MNTAQLIEDFEAIVGWPYASPGSNDERGIDCSGAFVRAFARQGEEIAHGSNSIYRKHCAQTGKIEAEENLAPGMAVFKHRADGGEPAHYGQDGLGNFYHIGLVTAVDPLRIVHATPPAAKVDEVLGNWSHWGVLKEAPVDLPEPLPQGMVVAQTGSTVNLRQNPSRQAGLVCRIPVGERVAVMEDRGDWQKIAWQGKRGWMLSAFIRREGTLADLLAELRALIARYAGGG